MKIVAIKDMSAGNSTIGEMWQETKVFDHQDRLIDVMAWACTQKKKVTLTIPDNYDQDVIDLAMRDGKS